MNIENKIQHLDGPILIIGASGFIGSNILIKILKHRNDVFGTSFSGKNWRLNKINSSVVVHMNMCDKESIKNIFTKINPKTIFDCSSFGAYSFEDSHKLIHKTNYICFIEMLEIAYKYNISAYIHAGSSSEYGLNSKKPHENDELIPNSHYAVSKVAASAVVKYYGKIIRFPILNLRLYSVYGPYEDSSRLIPVLCKKVVNKKLPTFAGQSISRDFIYIDDVVDAFITSAVKINPDIYGESINIGTGREIKLSEVAKIAKNIFQINKKVVFSSNSKRHWDTKNWFADVGKAKEIIGWKSCTDFEDGLLKTSEWWNNNTLSTNFKNLTKNNTVYKKNKNSITAIVACYKDGQAIPIMHKRLKEVFRKNDIDYEIIFINDNSPDDSHEIIKKISAKDHRVIGVTNSRNFGSQAAFLSGLELATKEACVLLDGDLQDPPELISSFIEKWRNGADIVYGNRVKREMPYFIEIFYKSFYIIFDMLSNIKIPRDAGDFSLIDKKAVYWLLKCKERDFLLRGLRAYIGFNQVGVDYIRPDREFGKSTNNWIKNIGWAKKAIFSFSQLPLHILTFIGFIAFISTLILATYTILLKLYDPLNVPQGITFLSLLVMFFGSISIFGIGILGEYIGKILEESKYRPRYIRDKIVINGNEVENQ